MNNLPLSIISKNGLPVFENNDAQAKTLSRSFVGVPAQTCLGLGLIVFTILSTPVFGADKPPILSRDDWRAKAPVMERMTKQTPKEIVIHHTGVPQNKKLGLAQKLRGLQDFSQKEKHWGDVPYHFYIGVSGQMGETRSVEYQGDTNTKYDLKDRIQIVVEGDFDKESPTGEQIASLKKLIAWLKQSYGISSARISVHNDHTSTSCPGKNLKKLLPELKG